LHCSKRRGAEGTKFAGNPVKKPIKQGESGRLAPQRASLSVDVINVLDRSHSRNITQIYALNNFSIDHF
jgi:hypothetical protein